MEIIKKIEAVQRALSRVSAAGPENWDRLLACSQALEEIKAELSETEAEEVEEDG
jgi:hypothetical protein